MIEILHPLQWKLHCKKQTKYNFFTSRRHRLNSPTHLPTQVVFFKRWFFCFISLCVVFLYNSFLRCFSSGLRIYFDHEALERKCLQLIVLRRTKIEFVAINKYLSSQTVCKHHCVLKSLFLKYCCTYCILKSLFLKYCCTYCIYKQIILL